MCEPEPIPADAKVIAPGFAFAAATRSATDFHPLPALTTRIFGCVPNSATEAKSCTGS